MEDNTVSEPEYVDIDESKKDIVNVVTGETIPHGANEDVAIVRFPEAPNLDKVGTLVVDDHAQKVLAEPLDPKDIKIRPDGNIYVPWTYYASRLNRAFGVAQWGLVPNGMPMSKKHGNYDDVLVAWGFWLVIKGIPIGYDIGETIYRPSNTMMSYTDACEGAKSSALARNCKILGMTLELWDKDFVDEWKREYAVSKKETLPGGKIKTTWEKKPIGKKPAEEVKITLEEAAVLTNAAGTRYEDLSDDDLQKVIDAPKAPAIKVAGAKKLLEHRKEKK